MRTAAIIQARMTSTRLPGKVMLDLGGRTIIDHVLSRCKVIRGVDVVCCAVPRTAESRPILDIAEALEIETFEGSEHDVLARYWEAGKALNADVVLRVTSDCPLIDPLVCSEVLALIRSKEAEFACNNMPPTWPHGLDCEAVTFDWLDKAYFEANKPFEREHVMPWIRNHPNVKKANYICPYDGIEQHRWTIDKDCDFQFLRELWKRLPQGEKENFSYCTPLSIVTSEPKLLAINAGQDRFEGLKKSMSVS